MPPTQIDELAARNVQLQKEAQEAKDEVQATKILKEEADREIETLKLKLTTAVHNEVVAKRKQEEAEALNQRARAQLANAKDQSAKLGKLENSNKALKARVIELEAAEKQRMGTPDIQAQLTQAKADLKAQKAQYEGIWQERKILEEGLARLKDDAKAVIQELMLLVPEPDLPSEKKAWAKRRAFLIEFVKELGKK